MHALIVFTHPTPYSLTHAVAAQLADGVRSSAPTHSVALADLTAEGFDPTYGEADIALFQKRGPVPADVAAEHARLERADALVLVYPIYWWSFPGQLKGWIDRVFTSGWAYEEAENGKLVKKLQRLPVHLVAIGGADAGTFTRHAYGQAMKTQIEHGIFDYCGAPVASSHLLLASDPGYPEAHLETARAIGRKLFAEPS
ncbi:NAD(P)H-dependent oxidoreductase [Phytopseudomonas punonensis]|uniref:NAD(P)H dehydrogenase (Quinone) n=1 Tax=Phytopseudomonas punonensis TaxID=1220495 RepID=A0A1M7FMZ4_9GAMM|nr:NAD(P)H-dependent oxidoreductase [Pseudomonas punonensis]SHM05414.1 NAD(P)H dehydrogenase (quinone) [Pseudomonas punonensis]